ncbi:MAG TPA: Holliday junction ATP-dependent DNA helicase RuvA [Candidatus Pacearchaeota archaeon]|nr:Holliday junction ATP-dependent DNA helicase RuvA [Candidatus Pacearchaeota archaeon]
MITFLKGKIIYKGSKSIFLLVQDIGYEIFLSPLNLGKIKEGTEEEIYTQLILKEKEIELYGFLSFNELELFKFLKTISGIGPKIALIFAEAGSLQKLKFKLENEKPPKGIGNKKMQKILLELTGKIKEIEKKQDKDEEVINALKSLGFSHKEIKNALSQVDKDVKDIEERIKAALQFLGR